jgi:glutaredoxin 2
MVTCCDEDIFDYRQKSYLHVSLTALDIFHFLLLFSLTLAQRILWPLRSRGFMITHSDAPQSVGLLWTSDRLVAETST